MTHDLNSPSQAISASGQESICLADFEALAKAKMPAMAWEYVTAGAGDEITLRWNEEAFQRIRLKPRVLVDVSKLDTRVTLFGQEHAFPILLAPTAGHKLLHAEGELASARGAGAADTAMVLSCFSGTSLEDVAAVAKSPLWFQLYVQPDHGFHSCAGGTRGGGGVPRALPDCGHSDNRRAQSRDPGCGETCRPCRT
jgi:hypothetical protein